MARKIIEMVDIFSLPHAIEMAHAYEMPTAEHFGEMKAMTSVITINADITEEQKQQTLLHEIMHVISNELALELEEAQVQRLANGFYNVLKSNPHLFDIKFKGEICVETLNVKDHPDHKCKGCK
jgi:hypothetical protein